MKARALFQEGRLDEAVELLNEELRSNPTDKQLRVFLFELLCFQGSYDRAEKQLDIVARGGPDAALGALLYRSALHGERTRQTMFEERDFPGNAAEVRPPSGILNGTPFESLSDADPRIGARFEIIAAGQYTWMPMNQVASLTMAAPKQLRDLMWAAGALLTAPDFQGEDLGEVLLPVMSPLSWQDADDNVRLGRVTEWVDWGAGMEVPLGQKMWLVDGEEIPLLEVRELVITPAESSD